MMLRGHLLASVAGQALAPVEAHTFRRIRRAMRIVARSARHLIAAGPLARAPEQRLVLARRPAAVFRSARIYEVDNEPCKILPRPIGRQGFARPIDRRIAFKMALQTHTIAQCRCQLRRVHDRPTPLLREMLGSIAMTRCACDTSSLKWRIRVLVPRLRECRLYLTRMTMQAIGVDRQRVRHARADP